MGEMFAHLDLMAKRCANAATRTKDKRDAIWLEARQINHAVPASDQTSATEWGE
jgi:hypothetical protein